MRGLANQQLTVIDHIITSLILTLILNLLDTKLQIAIGRTRQYVRLQAIFNKKELVFTKHLKKSTPFNFKTPLF